MVRLILPEELTAIIEIVRPYPDGAGLQDIAAALSDDMPVRTLQYRLQRLAEEGHLVKEGERRWIRYRLPPAGYNRAFLDYYHLNESFYLTAEECAHLAAVGKPAFEAVCGNLRQTDTEPPSDRPVLEFKPA